MANLTRPDAGADLWAQLRRYTPARIGFGRVGGSLPTQALLEFELAHARARDAVHAAFDAEGLAEALARAGFPAPLVVTSETHDRTQYLLRPDRGRVLDAKSRARLVSLRERNGASNLAVVIADGLSAVAPARHAPPLLGELRAIPGALDNVTVVIAHRARVALGDQIGEILGAEAVAVLIGERPGLSSPDSLGVYLTWAPRVGRTDADRNCISNIRPGGLDYSAAAQRLAYLLRQARQLQRSGVDLKDDSDDAAPLLR